MTIKNCVFVFLCHLATYYNYTNCVKTMKAAEFTPGGPENIVITEQSIPLLKEHDVLIRVMASAINRADLLQRKGLYAPPPNASKILGLEAAGVIHEVGSQVKQWQTGERVMALLTGGGNAEFVAVSAEHVMKIPENCDFIKAAAIPEVWLTAFQLLHVIASIKKGDNVLIHAGGSGVGTAAIQLTLLAGAIPIITAGSSDKIHKTLDLGAALAINYKEEDFVQKIQKFTNNKGVDIILDCVGSQYWEKNMETLAMDGTWVLYGLLGGGNVSGDILTKLLRKRATIKATTLRARSDEYKKILVKKFSDEILPHFTSGEINVVIDKIFPLNDLADAHRRMQDNINIGKIILQVADNFKDEL